MKTEDSTATQHDGHLVVRFSENDIEAWADFIPPAGQGKFITSAYLEYLMEELNINYGIQWDDIQEKALLCNTGRQPIQGVLVARGEVPVNEVGEYYDPVPNLINRPAPTKNSEHVDYRNFSPFTIVKKDQVLAVFRPRIEGRDGKDVHSTVLPFKAINHPGVSSGKNTRADDKNIIALIDGQLIEVSRSLNVEENLIVKGSVGYSTGHINFPGDVFIHGLVADGFKIYSGGSVTIKQTYDVTDVMTKGDLTVAGGLIGRGPALVKVGGLLRTKFIENCRVACRKTVSVTTEIVNSSIFAMEKLEMGDKSQILGGDIYAIHGVRTGNIGKKSGRSTQIHCGIDFTVQQEKDKCNNQLRMVDAKLHRLREIMAQSGHAGENPGRWSKMEEGLRQLETAQRQLSSRVAELLTQVNVDEAAVVEVSGELAADTLIEICQASFYVTTPLRKVRIRLDRTHGKILSESLVPVKGAKS